MSDIDNIRMTEAKTAMLLHVPFFASLLLDIMRVKITKDSTIWDELGTTPTAATDGKTIWFYDDFLTSLDVREAVFVICHEIGHMMWQHMPRAKTFMDLGFEGQEFQPMIWNIAGDFVINDMLVKSNIGQMPKIGLLAKQYTSEMLTDEVYRDLMKNAQPSGGGGSGKGQQGAGGKQGGGHGGFDTHIPGTEQISETELKRAVATASEAAKAVGKMPASLERFVESLLKPKVNWQERLRHHVTRASTRESTTWSSPHRRRLVTQKIYLPSYTGKGAGTIVVVFDTSGSIGEKELQIFLSELADILDTCKPEVVWLMSCDAAIDPASIHELYEGHDLVNHPPKIIGGGGTSFVPPFEWCKEQGLEPACLVYLTDLYGGFPEEPDFPVIWCCTTDKEAPFGETIKIDITVND
jgi:predicted metal-dependent peptidase